MKCLVVASHPLADSLCLHLAAKVMDRLKARGHEVVFEDLYAQNFQPALAPLERRTYYGEAYDFSAVADYVERLLEADVVILVFPTWWFSFPAVLKGWFDRVWGPGIAYDHADDYGPIRPRLSRLKTMIVITTMGAPWWVDRLLMRHPVKKVLKTALLGACAPGSKFKYLALYKSEKLHREQIRAFEAKIIHTLDSLERHRK